MARSAAIPLFLGGTASVLLISGIQGESIAEVLKGEFGKGTKHPFPDPGFKGSTAPEQNITTEATGLTGGSFAGIAGAVSPFPKGTSVQWGRSDQGVDGRVVPGTPLRAIGDGIVEIAHDPNGFGTNYPVLHITGDGSYYYGHSVPIVANGTRVKKGQIIAQANLHGQGNATTPGSFEIGTWPLGSFSHAGAEIRSWLMGLPKV
jgi:murein DD-endopeptidase MepM/ murein hydrolase activator NlpD